MQDRDLRGDCTIHTRSPESLLGASVRSWPVDMWSLGCVTAELALGKILMWSKDEAELDVWRNVVSILGTPSEMDWPEIRDTKRWKIVREESQVRAAWWRMEVYTTAPYIMFVSKNQ